MFKYLLFIETLKILSLTKLEHAIAKKICILGSILLQRAENTALIICLLKGIHILQRALWLHISENATNAMFPQSCAVNVNILNKTIFASSRKIERKQS